MSTLSTVNNPSLPLPIDNYPKAPIIMASQTATPFLQLTLLQTTQEDNRQSLVNSQNELVYHHHYPTSTDKTILYDATMKPLWKADHQNLTLVSDEHSVQLTPLFQFAFQDQTYHWQSSQNQLACYHTETRALLAHLEGQSFSLYNEHNPFRHQFTESSSLIALVVLSGLVVHQTLLNSCRHKEKLDNGNNDNDDNDDDITSLSSVYHYPGHHSLVADPSMRWSTTQSFKSIELDPGMWRCWWGYNFWWSWFPWCMPGGCCDRGCIYIRGRKPKGTLSKQGWQQQNY